MMVGNDSSSNKLKEGTVRSKGKTEGSSSKALQEQNVASASKSDRNEEENDNAMKGNKFCSSVLPSGSSKNETGIPCNKVNTRRVTRKHYSASKANNNGSAGENYTDNRKRRFRNEYLETEYVNRKQTSKDAVVIKNQGVKKQKTSLEEIASDLNKKGKTAKMCDKSSSSKSNQKGVTLAVVKRNDKPIVKREENCTKRTLEYENCDNDKKSGRKKIISSSSSSDSNEEQTKKRKGKVIENICLASTARETEDNSPAVIDRENEDISSTSSAKETKDNSPAVIDRENEDISSTSSAKETKGNSQAVIDRENEDISSTSIARETVDNSPAVIDRENEDISSTSNDRENKEKRNRRKKKKSSSIKEMDESYFDQLPQELVIHILHYLSYYSILRLRSTYTCFQKAAEKAEVWKGKVWKPNAFNTNTYKYELKRMPKIPEIYIPDIFQNLPRDSNEVIMESVLSYIENLRKLTVTDISLGFIQRITHKYTNLESVCLQVKAEDVLNVLENLSSNCKRLKQLDFVYAKFISELEPEILNRSYFRKADDPTLPEEYCKKVSTLLENAFPQLTSINLKYFQKFLSNEDIAFILEKRKNNLRCVELCLYSSCNNHLLNIISESGLKDLLLVIFVDNNTVPINIMQLKDVKNLSIFFDSFHRLKIELCDLLMFNSNLPFCMTNVKRLFFNRRIRIVSSDAVRCISKMFPKIEHLRLSRIKNDNFNDQISVLKTLPNLVDLSVSFRTHASPSAMSIAYVSQCSSLTCLMIRFLSENDIGDILLPISNLQNLQVLRLIQFVCQEKVIQSLVLSLKELKTLVLINYKVSCKSHNFCNEIHEIPLIDEECKKRYIYLQVVKQ